MCCQATGRLRAPDGIALARQTTNVTLWFFHHHDDNRLRAATNGGSYPHMMAPRRHAAWLAVEASPHCATDRALLCEGAGAITKSNAHCGERP
jgi:hypothetical protein